MVLQIWQKTKTKNLNMYDFPVHDYIQEQNGSPYFVLFQQCNGRLYQERLLRSTNFATMVTLRRTSPLYTGIQLVEYLSPKMSCNDWM